MSCQGAMKVGHGVPSVVANNMGSIELCVYVCAATSEVTSDCSSCVSMRLWSYPPLQSKKPGVNPFHKGTGQLFKGAPCLPGAVCVATCSLSIYWLWVYYNQNPIYPIFDLLKWDYSPVNILLDFKAWQLLVQGSM